MASEGNLSKSKKLKTIFVMFLLLLCGFVNLVSIPVSSTTGNESVSIYPETRWVHQGDTINATYVVTGLSTSVTYQIDWEVCKYTPVNNNHVNDLPCSQTNSIYDSDSIMIPTGITSFGALFTIDFSTTTNGNNGNGSQEDTFFRFWLKTSNGLMVEQDAVRMQVGDNSYLSHRYVEVVGVTGTDFLLGDYPRLAVRGWGLNSYLSTNYSLVTEIIDPNGDVFSNTQNYRPGNSYHWYYSSVNISTLDPGLVTLIPGTYTIYTNHTDEDLNYQRHHYAPLTFTITDLGLTGNEAVTIAPETRWAHLGDTITTELNVTGLNPSNTYEAKITLCYASSGSGVSLSCPSYRVFSEVIISITGSSTYYDNNLQISTTSAGYPTNGTYSTLFVILSVVTPNINYVLEADSLRIQVGDNSQLSRRYVEVVGVAGTDFILGTHFPRLAVQGSGLNYWVNTNYSLTTEIIDPNGNKYTIVDNHRQSGGSSHWYHGSVNISTLDPGLATLIPGTYTIYTNHTDEDLNYQRHHYAPMTFTMLNIAITGNEDVEIDPETRWIHAGDTISAVLDVTGLNPSLTYNVSWELCADTPSSNNYLNGQECDPYPSTNMYASGVITITGVSNYLDNNFQISVPANSPNASRNDMFLRAKISVQLPLTDIDLNFDSIMMQVGDNSRLSSRYVEVVGVSGNEFLLGNDFPRLAIQAYGLNNYLHTNYSLTTEIIDPNGNKYTIVDNYRPGGSSHWYYASYNLSLLDPGLATYVQGTYTIYTNHTDEDLNYQRHHYDPLIFNMSLPGGNDDSEIIVETGELGPSLGIGWANVTTTNQNINEWYQVDWYITDSNNNVVNSSYFGWLSIASTYNHNMTINDLGGDTYCFNANLTLANTPYLLDTSSSCFFVSIPDDDGDLVGNDDDLCPNTPPQEISLVDGDGCSPSELDDDDDGIMNDVDQCPNENSTGFDTDGDGCLDDTDGDGLTDDIDQCPNEDASGFDTDGDGCLDDTDGDGVTDDIDQCPNENSTGFDTDGDGCLDTDGDGVNDQVDLCPNTNVSTIVDTNGCSDDQNLDDDVDGVNNQDDLCPNTFDPNLDPGYTPAVDVNGCHENERDTDDDGVNDDIDICPNTPAGAIVNSDGCPSQTTDTDGDGIMDYWDNCPMQDSTGYDTDNDGCLDDGDGDSITDDIDQCLTEDSTGYDTDGDGCLDDTDGDGFTDDIDICPNEDSTGYDLDADGCLDDEDSDGYIDAFDSCLGTPLGEVIVSIGCSDSQLDDDNDGLMNNVDQCPNEASTGFDVDNDGCLDDPDNDGYTDDVDLCPNENSTGFDTNGDGCLDDTDGDGYTDDVDQCPNEDSTSYDKDNDGCLDINTPPICDIYYSMEDQGVVVQGDAVLTSVSGSGSIQIPPGRYFIVANCYDPEGDVVSATITSPIGSVSESGTTIAVGALVEVVEEMDFTIPVSVVWDDGVNQNQANIVVELGDVPQQSTPGFVSTLTIISMISAVLYLRRQEQNE